MNLPVLFIILSAFFGLLLAKSTGIEKPREFNAENYPNSEVDWRVCGLLEPGLACDPNDILGPKETGVVLVDAVLKHIRKSTKCVCKDPKLISQRGVLDKEDTALSSQCSSDPPRGFTLSVAILRKIQDNKSVGSKQHLAMVFANSLLERLDRGQCNDDALLVLSIEDSAVWTATRPSIEHILTPQFITNCSLSAQKHFVSGDYAKGILQMLDGYATRLGAPPRPPKVEEVKQASSGGFGEWLDQHFWTLFPDSIRESEWRWVIAALLFILLALVLILLICCVVMKSSSNRGHNGSEYMSVQRETGGGKTAYYKS